MLSPALSLMILLAALVQVAYGATILSFLGGVHWGVAMTPVGGQVRLLVSSYITGLGCMGGKACSLNRVAHFSW